MIQHHLGCCVPTWISCRTATLKVQIHFSCELVCQLLSSVHDYSCEMTAVHFLLNCLFLKVSFRPHDSTTCVSLLHLTLWSNNLGQSVQYQRHVRLCMKVWRIVACHQFASSICAALTLWKCSRTLTGFDHSIDISTDWKITKREKETSLF